MLNDASCFKRVIIAAGYTDLRSRIDKLAAIIKFRCKIEPHYEQYIKFSKLACEIYGCYTDQIDLLKHKCRAASPKVCGCGIRYTVMIGGHESFLFNEDEKWFVEAKEQCL